MGHIVSNGHQNPTGTHFILKGLEDRVEAVEQALQACASAEAPELVHGSVEESAGIAEDSEAGSRDDARLQVLEDFVPDVAHGVAGGLRECT